jgi:hypothetical protein
MRPEGGLHLWLCDTLTDLHRQRGFKLSCVAPRGSAKSSWVSWAYVLYVLCHGYERYVMLVSDTATQARLYLANVRHELEENQSLARDHPAAFGHGPVWREERIILRNGCVVEALGTGDKIRGRRHRAERPTLVILDDPQNDEQVASHVQRQKH